MEEVTVLGLAVGSWADWFGTVGSVLAIVTSVIVVKVQLNSQRKADREQYIFEREYDELESQIKIVDDMTKIFLITLNSFSRYDIRTDDFSEHIYDGFRDGLYSLSQQNMELETWAEGYFENEGDIEINLINDLKGTINDLNRQRDGIQRKNYFNKRPDDNGGDGFRQFVPADVERLSRSGKEITERLRLELFKRLQALKRSL